MRCFHQHSSRGATAAAVAAREGGRGGRDGRDCTPLTSPRERMEKKWEAKEEERDDDRGERDVEEERGFAEEFCSRAAAALLCFCSAAATG